MDRYDSPVRSPIVVPKNHSSIPQNQPVFDERGLDSQVKFKLFLRAMILHVQ